MPKKSVRNHGSQAGEQTKVENYKNIQNYKELAINNTQINQNLQFLYQDNIWDLPQKFQLLKDYYQQIGISNLISWEQGVYLLDFKKLPPTKKVSVKKFLNGEYKSIETERPNSITTESKYAKRIIFYTKTFKPFNKYKDDDDFSWILKHNQELFYEIMMYHNFEKKNQLSSVNDDLKAMIRCLKLILKNPDEQEIRWKYSALQIALGDIDRYKNDLNEISSVNELKSFVPYENLLDLVDRLENDYENDNTNNKFFKNQLLIAVASMVLDFPSRMDKFEMEIIDDIKDVKYGKCYILTTNPLTFIFNNGKKQHKPISYQLNATSISGFNSRLNRIIITSLIRYPRKSLFVNKDTFKPVKEDTVAEWIRFLIPNKTLNVGTFRSSFVSYFYPKFNNLDKKIMVLRMRTSIDEINRAYLKFYSNPDTLVKVKVEPTQELLQKVLTGKKDTPIIVNNNNTGLIKVKDEPADEEYFQPQPIQPVQPIQHQLTRNEQKKINSKIWYENNKEYQKNKSKSKNNPQAYRLRYINELNSNKLEFKSLKKETIDKYDIKYDAVKKLYY